MREVPVVPDRADTSADGTLWYFEGYSCGAAGLILLTVLLFFLLSGDRLWWRVHRALRPDIFESLPVVIFTGCCVLSDDSEQTGNTSRG